MTKCHQNNQRQLSFITKQENFERVQKIVLLWQKKRESERFITKKWSVKHQEGPSR